MMSKQTQNGLTAEISELTFKENLRFRVLRGPHVDESVAPLTELLADAHIIGIETVGPPYIKRGWDGIFWRLATDNLTIEEFGKNLEENIAGNWIARLVWNFRGKRKIFIGVDADTSDPPTEEELAKYFPMRNYTELLEAVVRNPEGRYNVLKEYFKNEVHKINLRDQIVAKQIKDFLDTQDKIWRQYALNDGICEVVVVQGFLHDASQYIRNYFPETPISTEVYNEADIAKHATMQPLVKLLSKDADGINLDLTNKDIDYYLYSTLSQAKNTVARLTPDDQSTLLEMHGSLKSSKENVLKMLDLLQSPDNLKDIDHFKTEELKDIVTKMLSDEKISLK